MSLLTIGQIIAPSFQQNQLAHAIVIETLDANKTHNQLIDATKLMLCAHPDYSQGVGCGGCKHCQLVQAGSHPDLTFVAGSSTSIGIDEIRLVSNKLTKKFQLADVQVVVIENAQSMTENAANALLKTLEEPSDNCFLILVSQGYVKLIPTILSRCQQIKQPVLTKLELQQKYPHLPDYLVGFADQNESFLESLQASQKLDLFTELYRDFISWLKIQVTSQQLIAQIVDDELSEFFVYLVERRTRQMLLKGHAKNAQQSQQSINEFIFARRNVKGHNKALALSAFVQNLEGTIR